MAHTLADFHAAERLSRARLAAIRGKMMDQSLTPRQRAALRRMLPLQTKAVEGRRRLVWFAQRAETLKLLRAQSRR